MKIDCAYDKLLDINDPTIIPNPKNPNRHSIEQIERLAKIIDYQGQRSPIVISNRSGFITKGHGRLLAIQKLEWEKIAVDFQDYENEAQEWSDIIADNAIAEWSELDKQMIFDSIPELDLDVELLGIEDFKIEKEKEKKEEKEIDINFEYKIEIDCKDEENQKYLTSELEDRGFKVRVLI